MICLHNQFIFDLQIDFSTVHWLQAFIIYNQQWIFISNIYIKMEKEF